MPVCHCASAGCGSLYGRSVDARTLKNHSRADEQKALEASTQAANEQEESITRYFASLALSDDSDLYESQRMSENHMWYGEVPPQSSANGSTVASGRSAGTTRPTNCERVLDRLSKIDADVDALSKDVSDLLGSKNDDKTALKSLIKGLLARLKQLDDDLQRAVTKDYKNHSITELRQSIGHKLSAVYTSLSTANQKCHNESVHPRLRHPNHYHSGSYLFQPCRQIYSSSIRRPFFQANLAWC